jgi:hypothetical protein
MTYKENLDSAARHAAYGNVDFMFGALKQAEQDWKEGDLPPFPDVRRGIEYVGLSKGLDAKLEGLRPLAIRGEGEKLEVAIKACEGYANTVQTDISKVVSDLRTTLEGNELPKLLEQLKTHVETGAHDKVEEVVSAARQYAGDVNINDLIEAAKNVGPYNAQIDDYFAQALEYAGRGSVQIAASRVAAARELAEQYTVDISAREKKVETATTEWKMGDALKKARQFAKQRTIPRKREEVRDFLETAKKCAEKLGQDIGGQVKAIEKKLD